MSKPEVFFNELLQAVCGFQDRRSDLGHWVDLAAVWSVHVSVNDEVPAEYERCVYRCLQNVPRLQM